MSTVRIKDANAQVLRAFGITQKNIVAADISLRPGQLPRFMVDCLADPATMLHEVLAFDLVPREPVREAPAPLDLDALCAAARTRLTAEVQHSASMALADQHRESAAIRARMGKASARHSEACVRALVRLDMACTLRPMVGMGGIFAGALGGLSSIGFGGMPR